MKQFKRLSRFKKGFALFEVILALTFSAVVLTALFSLQSVLFRAVMRKHEALERIFVLRNNFFDHKLMRKFSIAPSNETILSEALIEPKMSVSVEAKGLGDSKYPNLFILQSSGNWQGMFREHEERIVSAFWAKGEQKFEEKEEEKKLSKKVSDSAIKAPEDNKNEKKEKL